MGKLTWAQQGQKLWTSVPFCFSLKILTVLHLPSLKEKNRPKTTSAVCRESGPIRQPLDVMIMTH